MFDHYTRRDWTIVGAVAALVIAMLLALALTDGFASTEQRTTRGDGWCDNYEWLADRYMEQGNWPKAAEYENRMARAGCWNN